MNVFVGAIPGHHVSSNFMSHMAVSYAGKMPPWVATFRNSHPPTPRVATPAIAFSFSVYVLILNALGMLAIIAARECSAPMSQATCRCCKGLCSIVVGNCKYQCFRFCTTVHQVLASMNRTSQFFTGGPFFMAMTIGAKTQCLKP